VYKLWGGLVRACRETSRRGKKRPKSPRSSGLYRCDPTKRKNDIGEAMRLQNQRSRFPIARIDTAWHKKRIGWETDCGHTNEMALRLSNREGGGHRRKRGLVFREGRKKPQTNRIWDDCSGPNRKGAHTDRAEDLTKTAARGS